MATSEIINDNINDNINDTVNDLVNEVEIETTDDSEQSFMTLEELDTFVGDRIAKAFTTFGQYIEESFIPLSELIENIALDANFARSVLTQDENLKAIYEDIKAQQTKDTSPAENEQTETEEIEDETMEEVPDNVDIQTES